MTDKWADYLVSDVRYNSDHTHIIQLSVLSDNGSYVGDPEIWTRALVVEAIEDGNTFVTIYKNDDGKWNQGAEVIIVVINGKKYLKTQSNTKEEDNLGDLPEF